MSLYERKHNNGIMAMRMGVVIDNESIEKKSVWFLGAKAQRVKGVSVYNMFGETFMGDNSMSTLQNWLLSVGSVEICLIRLSSQDLQKNIGHTLLIKDYDATGIEHDNSINIWNYFNPNQFSTNVLDIPTTMRIGGYTSFNVEIEPYGKIAILFFPSNHISNAKKFSTPKYESMQKEFEEENKNHTENTKKRYLLLLR